jgi:hypothetical protein
MRPHLAAGPRASSRAASTSAQNSRRLLSHVLKVFVSDRFLGGPESNVLKFAHPLLPQVGSELKGCRFWIASCSGGSKKLQMPKCTIVSPYATRSDLRNNGESQEQAKVKRRLLLPCVNLPQSAPEAIAAYSMRRLDGHPARHSPFQMNGISDPPGSYNRVAGSHWTICAQGRNQQRVHRFKAVDHRGRVLRMVPPPRESRPIL